MYKLFLLFFVLLFSQINLFSSDIYFPPLKGDNWDKLSLEELGWDTSAVKPLYNFLEDKNTKAFIVLSNGKIVLEKYFGAFTADSNWYWASAGKTLTALVVGTAQESGLLNIDDKTSDYLGKGWTSAPQEKEDMITIKNQLSMTSGLDEKVGDTYCTDKECLIYKADAGTRWAYHTAAYSILDQVIEAASSQNYNVFFADKIKNKIGMNGLWAKVDYNNVYFSTARSMARYGILLQNNCIWDKDTVLKDYSYYLQMTNSSQDLNPSYGYLTWLNGKSSYMMPLVNITFPGKLLKNAPDDVFAALGKNGQCLNVCKSKGIVFVRIGDAPSNDKLEVTSAFDDDIWDYLNKITENDSFAGYESSADINIYPNPASEYINISNYEGKYEILNSLGITVISSTITGSRIDISSLENGLYFLKTNNSVNKFVVIK